MHGDRIGHLDGIPADVRDRANLALLAQQKANLIEMRDRNGALPMALGARMHVTGPRGRR
jgi:hypothetical protein